MTTNAKKAQALKLFDTMYRERTIRDHYYAIMSMLPEAETEADIREAEEISCIAKSHNAASNKAMLKLQDLGYFAFRDEDNNDVPTLKYGLLVIAYWDENDGVTQVVPEPRADIETMAKAIETVPGFSRLLYQAASSLADSRRYIAEAAEYKATHKRAQGKQYARLQRWLTESQGAFLALTDAIDAILDAVNPECEFHATMEEVDALVSSVPAAELYRTSRGY